MAIYICFKKFDYDKFQVKIIFKSQFFIYIEPIHLIYTYDSIFIQLPSYKLTVYNCSILFLQKYSTSSYSLAAWAITVCLHIEK